MKADPQTRRQFCARTCSAAALAALGAAFAGALQGCGGGSPTSPGGGVSAASLADGRRNRERRHRSRSRSTARRSPRAGALALVRSSIGSVLVARTGAEAFTALSSVCTHQACSITGYSGQIFVCPCHGSQFDASGKVLAGPAPTSLRQYTTQFAERRPHDQRVNIRLWRSELQREDPRASDPEVFYETPQDLVGRDGSRGRFGGFADAGRRRGAFRGSRERARARRRGPRGGARVRSCVARRGGAPWPLRRVRSPASFAALDAQPAPSPAPAPRAGRLRVQRRLPHAAQDPQVRELRHAAALRHAGRASARSSTTATAPTARAPLHGALAVGTAVLFARQHRHRRLEHRRRDARTRTTARSGWSTAS